MSKWILTTFLALAVLVTGNLARAEAKVESEPTGVVGLPMLPVVEEDTFYFGLAGGTGFSDVMGGDNEVLYSGVVAYAAKEGIWFELEPTKAINDSISMGVTYTKVGYRLYDDGFDVYLGAQLIDREDADKDNYGGWVGVMFPISEEIIARMGVDYFEEGGSAVKVTFFKEMF